MIVFERRFVLVGENWFDEEPDISSVDVVKYVQRSSPMDGICYEEFHTMLIDLNQDSDVLMSKMNKNTRYEIKRADARDGLVYEYYAAPTISLISEFCDFYDHFALQKGLAKIDRAVIQTYANYRVLGLSRVRMDDGKTLVWRCYYCSSDRVRSLKSASYFRDSQNSEIRRLIGRANRYGHWQGMLRFKTEGISTYDMSGWYSGSQDEDKLRINKFKEGFGGETFKNYNFERGITVKGKLYLRARRIEILRKALKLFRS